MTADSRIVEKIRERCFHPLAVPLGLLLLTLAMFGDVLFFPNGRALSLQKEDFATQFFYFYEFGFRELREGNFPLWNPHVFSGTPWFGNFESALLYPPQWIFLLLPPGIAVNWFIAFHIFLLGWFVSLLARHHQLHPAAQFVASACAMFGSAYFFRIMPGHTTIIGTQAWLPLVLLCIDKLLDTRDTSERVDAAPGYSSGWILCGSFAVTMQLMAGHPQSAFRTGVVAMLYLALRLLQQRENWRAALTIPAFYFGAAALAAVQIGAGLAVAGESTRQGATPLEFARLFPFPPENFLTLFAPSFFGNSTDLIYWGRNLPWEGTLFIGVAGLALAIYGAIFGHLNQSVKNLRFLHIALIAVLLVLALGSHTPVFYWLYYYVPGFNKFRTAAEYVFPASIFMALLSGIGLDALLRHPQRVRPIALVLIALAGFLIFSAFGIQHLASQGAGNAWYRALSAMRETQQSIMSGRDAGVFLNPTFQSSAADYAFTNLVMAAGVLLVMAFLIYRAKYSRRAVYLVALLAVTEIFAFARENRPVFQLQNIKQPMVESFLKTNRGQERILNLSSLNSAMSFRAYDIWGYDPVMMKRYVEFMAWTQGQNPDTAVIAIDFKQYHPLYRMLRHRYTFIPDAVNRQEVRIGETSGALPRFLLINDYKVVTQRDEIFAAMSDKNFDPARMVILESQPAIKPSATKPELLRGGVLDDSTNHITLELEVGKPSILLITDSYSRYWQARALPDSVQQEYSVQPANYVLRAVALQKGKHRFHLEYRPQAFIIGRWISLCALAIYMGLFIAWYYRQTRTTAPK